MPNPTPGQYDALIAQADAADEVAEIRNQWGGSVYEGAILRLCNSHEALRAELAAMTAVARRYRDGWRPDAPNKTWLAAHRMWDPEPVTDAEAGALDALESDDG